LKGSPQEQETLRGTAQVRLRGKSRHSLQDSCLRAKVKDAKSANHSPNGVGENITAPGTTHKALTITMGGLGHCAIGAFGGCLDSGR